jgi:hypothetical protein
MSRPRMLTLMLAGLTLAVAACNQPEVVTALDRTFHLGVGRQAVMPKERLEVGFASVNGDSRCPEGTTCVWAGQARLAMWLRPEGGGTPEAFEAVVSGAASPDSTPPVNVGDYSVRIMKLLPYPKGGQAIDSTTYVVELRVSKR